MNILPDLRIVSIRFLAIVLVASAFFLCELPTQYLLAQQSADSAQDTEQQVSFYNQVRPIFQAKCYGCHQGAKQAGQYVMTDFARMLAGGESNDPAVVPGKPEESYLFELIVVEDGFAEMPRDDSPLSLPEIEIIKNWILQGAQNDTPQHAAIKFTAEHPPKYKLLPTVTSLDVSPDGKTIAVAGYHEILLHSVDLNKPKSTSTETIDSNVDPVRLVGLSERIESVKFSPDGKRVAACGGSPGRMGEVQVWDINARKLVLSKQVGYDTLYGVSWSGDGKLIAFGCPDATVRAIDSSSGKQILFNGAHSDWVLDTEFSTKNDHLITVSRDMSMKLIKVDTQRFVDNITSITPGALKGGLNAVDCHPTKDVLLAAGADGTPRIYKMLRDKARKIGDDFNLIRAFEKLDGRVFDAAFSSDGKWIAAASSINGHGQMKVFATETGKTISNFTTESGGLFAVAFIPQTQLVAVAGFDGVIRIVDVQSGKSQSQFDSAPLENKQK